IAAAQLALLIDIDRCIGCHACSIVCQQEHGDPRPVQRLKVPTVGSGHHDIPAGVYPNVWMYFQPRMCQHCVNPPCIESCPFDAVEKRGNGIVVIVDDNCTGCELCLPACPYGVIAMDTETRIVSICDLCSSRLEVGLQPACADACPAGAIFFGDTENVESDINIQKQKLSKSSFALSGGGRHDDRPSVRYQSHRPPHEEDRTIVKVDW
ncbi:MAG TPA: 4Fe-4S dicluster domain-containing protein, partial [Dehalococcoidia bacterium]|nr:4Fe-4S dicluster domain-containing protein [Dehalococcoidia bacterium]